MKKLMLFAMWLAASGAAVATAWAGVSVVDNQVAPPSVIGLDRGDSELATQRPDGGVAESTATSTRPPITQDSQLPATSSSNIAPSTDAPTTNTSAPSATPNSSAGTSTPPTGGATQPSISQATSSTAQLTTSTMQPTTSTTQADTSTTQGGATQTFNLVGGSTAVSFSPSGVQVLWATPKPGFDVEIEKEGSGMKVEFESDDHQSRIDVWWSGGPRHDIRERDD